ncbi:hypothetical protein GL325_10435 [Aeromicrobium sp. 636]|uniref:Uncharacterized protein n=1 Tax=Aeromicrobium senzhongii TaxID=2663859 RepID=A0A8I0EWE0_9ACTN|nr:MULTISPECIES: hypothetical protein [Aeromicrobium]MBC9226744.1 hypothetical protein [Aeromicrobium senzhongii]MCQ3998844.1 hypothetical protein [Aeromicrobium sp. 636]
MRRALVALMLCGIALSGCGKEDDMDLQDRAEARAVEARAHVDDLAQRLGTDPEVVQDEITTCVPGQDDSGLDLIYTVHVTTGVDAAERLPGDIAEHFAAEGWQVKRDHREPGSDEVSLRFTKGTFTMGANLNTSNGRAAVGGSGGCVR